MPVNGIVRLRNLVVHQYEEVDPALVYDIVETKLHVLRQLRDEIDRYETGPGQARK